MIEEMCLFNSVWRRNMLSKTHVTISTTTIYMKIANILSTIDYILINKKYQNSIKRIAAYLGADIESDHNFLIGTLILGRKH